MNFRMTTATAEEIKQMTRRELWAYLESRGCACFSDESTALLRETALEDIEQPKEPL